jgi:hypothetical protein
MKPSSIIFLQPRYLLSLPERLLRALAAFFGGLLYETTQIALPERFRQTRLYRALVYRTLRLMVEMIGDVQQVFPTDGIAAGELAIRKTVGNVVEFAGFLVMGVSPLWVLAAASDLMGGTRDYLKVFIAELEKDGLLPEKVKLQSVDDLLNALESSTALMADAVDIPPMRVQDLQKSWETLRQNASSLPEPSRLAGLYQLLQETASQEGRSIGSLSSLVAAGAVRAGYRLGSVHIFDYYQQALRAIRTEGWGTYLRRTAKPYFIVARSHFDPKRMTFTERGFKQRIN